ncbi:hypothetical protein [Kriegella aquimaris]|uniref:MazG nucleotide pyrophosphohydrolase domain-containing protein n=1 Tax=Kriegella aquimaris TaxID=192904 RepID=A0A1G9IH85_9FLAO|nr:hypothetical protein [Kriegella aquimaris]SDL24608.1 hypothetical protein SAMN04488514_101141 [Kriegella aquimaris]
MTDNEKKDLIKTSWALHAQVERGYLNHQAKQGDDDWLEKQRLLLADMALHLLQTAMLPGEIKSERLRDNLHAVLTISDQFLPQADLKKATEKIYSE